MAPRQVLLMRHAEKTGDPRDANLAPAGVMRARALAEWLPRTFGAPDLLFASARSRHSERPIQTLQPLAATIQRRIDTDYADQDYGALAADLLSRRHADGKLVVVCWHHGNIPGLAWGLGAPPRSYPDPWDPAVFNLVLRVDFSPSPTVRAVTEPF